jgi:hypothetical protein
MAEPQPSKLAMRVRFSSPAPWRKPPSRSFLTRTSHRSPIPEGIAPALAVKRVRGCLTTTRLGSALAGGTLWDCPQLQRHGYLPGDDPRRLRLGRGIWAILAGEIEREGVDPTAGGGERRHSHDASTQTNRRRARPRMLGLHRREACGGGLACVPACPCWPGQLSRTRPASASTAAATAAGLLTGVR